MGFGFGGFGFLLMLLFWLLLIGLIAWAIIQFFSRSGAQSDARGHGQNQLTTRQDTALEVLKQRYARGEITKSEYEEMRRELTI
ncbi:MAG: SHOCT domain-containing protein [Chloroflexi bacterium]|nr:SHOCT domain-containing protein [Chloroflexota bacterium]